MAPAKHPPITDDPFDLTRFIEAQAPSYEDALAEIAAGRKRSHWMWFIFPQIEGLAHSSMSRRYSIKSVEEALAYLAHALLGRRLRECAEAVLAVQGRSAAEIFGFPDDLKLRSCATLFSSVAPAGSVFHRILDRYYEGNPDDRTLRILETLPASAGTQERRPE